MRMFAGAWRLVALVVGFVALVAGPAGAQEAQGGGSPRAPKVRGTRRAVIIGVSQYLYLPRDRQLSYAAADAEMLYGVLTSKAGGSLPPENVRKLLNQDARAQAIRAALRWLLAESREGDDVIIYFAGQIDAGPVTVEQTGFLLGSDATLTDYYGGGTIEVDYLANIARTIASKKATVLVITDASRCGKLVDAAGAKRTTVALLEQWGGVTKLVSSRADQCSWESDQWGGGHGVFTYFLVAGLQGLADLDGDGVVTLQELTQYVRERVAFETHAQQTPTSSGDLNRVIAVVDREPCGQSAQG